MSELVHHLTGATAELPGVASLVLDSPRNRNALSRRLVSELYDGLAAAEADDEVARSAPRSCRATRWSAGDQAGQVCAQLTGLEALAPGGSGTSTSDGAGTSTSDGAGTSTSDGAGTSTSDGAACSTGAGDEAHRSGQRPRSRDVGHARGGCWS
jgi:hypothetical protein